MADWLDYCPRCNQEHTFFPREDVEYQVGQSQYCPRCGLEVIIDWDGEEGVDAKRYLFWYTEDAQ
jgi:hypothetical protein